MDVTRVETAERELDRFINSRSKDRQTANEEARIQKAEDARRLQALYAENRVLWIAHFRRLAACNLAAARDYRRRARALLEEQPGRTEA